MKIILSLIILFLSACNQNDITPETPVPNPIYYRLYQIDFDGQDETFDAISVNTNRLAGDWWEGIGDPWEPFCNVNPNICNLIPLFYNPWCEANPEDCAAFCIVNPSLCIALPIELLSFTAIYENDVMTIQFETGSETNASHVIIQGSINGEEWSDVGEVPSKCESGNCSTGFTYEFIDNLNWILK